jgi:hypothetical protein
VRARPLHIALAAILAAAPLAHAQAPAGSDSSAATAQPPDSSSGPLRFEPVGADSLEESREGSVADDEWLRAPYGENLVSDPDVWRSRQESRWEHARDVDPKFHLSYNRVDRIRLGLGVEVQAPETMYPRFGARLQYAFDRDRWLYGVQLEQPLASPGRLAAGVMMLRRTDWHPLHQVDDTENSLALLFGRNDYRDYWEREGFAAYVAWRVPDFSTVSVNYRSDDERTVELVESTRSWFHRDRELRDNPPIDDGRTQAVAIRLDRFEHATGRARAGVYHWIEMEWAGQGLGGDFDYTKALADVRTVVRLTPVSALSARAVAGHTFHGTLPAQKLHPLGGVDGLRAQNFARFSGDELVLGQAEYQIELGRLARKGYDAGVHAIVFVDVGHAWTSPDNSFDIGRQQLQTDAGFGFAASENRMRVYFAKDLKSRDGDFLVVLRLQRPF